MENIILHSFEENFFSTFVYMRSSIEDTINLIHTSQRERKKVRGFARPFFLSLLIYLFLTFTVRYAKNVHAYFLLRVYELEVKSVLFFRREAVILNMID